MDDKQKTLGPGWDHLFLRDSRTPEERVEAERKERDRRKGRGRKDWFLHEPERPQKG